MARKPMPPKITYALPDDQSLLASVGEITLRHGHLDHALKMMIKSLARVTVAEALDATAREGSRALRERIGKLARKEIGEGAALVKLQALLRRCERLTEKRNELVHSIWAQSWDGEGGIADENHQWRDLPDVTKLDHVAIQLAAIVVEMNEARLHGFIAAALAKRRAGTVHD